MRYRDERGFTLVEVLLASGLLVIILIIMTDILIGVMGQRNVDDLNYEVNRECQNLMTRMTADIRAAGFRFTDFSIVRDSDGDGVDDETMVALSTPDVNWLQMRCVTDVGQLATAANPGSYPPGAPCRLTLTGFGRLEGMTGLVCAYNGNNVYLSVVGIYPAINQVDVVGTIKDNAIPAGTPLVAIRRIDYRIVGSNLTRSINGVVQETTPIDPGDVGNEQTWIRYILDDPADAGDATTEEDTIDNGDLPNLLFVNIRVQMTRAGVVSRGNAIDVTNTTTQRVAPLNLNVFGSQ